MSLNDVREALGGMSRSSVYRLTDAGKIPQPFYISERMPRWKASDIEAAIKRLEGQEVSDA
jgi:predicted DNA-binding transcriptional regulator AlpA